MMGYRSQVAVALDEKEAKILESLCKQDADLKSLMDDCDYNDDFESFGWSSIKWYDSYSEIAKICTFLDNLDQEKFHFLRIGEDEQDTENSGVLESSMYVHRSIERW